MVRTRTCRTQSSKKTVHYGDSRKNTHSDPIELVAGEAVKMIHMMRRFHKVNFSFNRFIILLV
ncbi:hypothetical protein BH23BAC3_BH23BAC3_06850 [soil metagenome]